MARAAEYAAAQSARARQVRRETEEQKLPPKPAPVSLSAFTKGQPTTRNKGNKAWKPLTSDDLVGDENYSDSPESRKQTPCHPDDEDEPRNTRRLVARPAQSSIEDLKIPTAPKAMLIQRDRPAVLLNSTPRRLTTHPAMAYPQQNPQAPEGMSGRGGQGRLLFNLPQSSHRPSRRSRNAYLHNMHFPGTPFNRAESMPAQPMYGHELHPAAYLTPSREEIAEVMQERDRQHMMNMANLQPGMAQQQGSDPYIVYNESPVQYYNHNPGDYDGSRYAQGIPPSYGSTPPAFYLAQQTDARFDASSVFQSTPPSYQAPRNTDQNTALYHPDYRKPDVPYDRSRIMEEYKATTAKVALEKKGKTVLYNPELHNPQGISPGPASSSIIMGRQGESKSFVDEGFNDDDAPWPELEGMVEKFREALYDPTEDPKRSTKEASYDVYKTMQTDIFAGNANAPRISMMGPPPGLEMPVDGGSDLRGNGLKEFPDDFYTLKALSTMERKNVQRLAQEARDDLAGTFKTPFTSQGVDSEFGGSTRQPLFSGKTDENINRVRAKEAEKWFYGPNTLEETIRDNVLAAKMHEFAIRDNALGKKGEKETAMEKAMMTAVIGNVTRNVKNIWDDCKLPDDKRTYPFKVKPVPDYAIERPSVMTGGASIFSGFFDDLGVKGETEKAVLPTPKRIARDPRFRPAAPKEGVKLTVEEERAARREAYGRRGGI
jgi:hypothetical protein